MSDIENTFGGRLKYSEGWRKPALYAALQNQRQADESLAAPLIFLQSTKVSWLRRLPGIWTLKRYFADGQI